ncbi:MRH domain-containing protein [Entamoeba marina]
MKLELLIIFIAFTFATDCGDLDLHRDEDYKWSNDNGDIYFNLCGPLETTISQYDTSDVSVLADLLTLNGFVTLGKYSTETITDVDNGVQFDYRGEDFSTTHFYTRVVVTCGDEDTSSDANVYPEDTTFVIEFSHPGACKKGGFPWVGITLLCLLFAGVICYIVVMVILNVFVFHKSGLEIIPNYEFWVMLPGLILDGIMFTFTCKKRGSEYKTFDI